MPQIDPLSDQARLHNPGPIVLFGSGETSPAGRKVWQSILRRWRPPVSISVLETPAGFEPNSSLVAGRVAAFLTQRLPEHQPQVHIVPARQLGTAYSPDDPGICEPLLRSDLGFLGPGSPTYAVRQLRGSYAWDAVRARHATGGGLVLASAACVAVSRWTLPVYEIYKVGADLAWVPGLNLLGDFGLDVTFVPHWNNAEGGADLDTSRCFMGQARFGRLLPMLDEGSAGILGIDEHTALVIDLAGGTAVAAGLGRVTIIARGVQTHYSPGQAFALDVFKAAATARPAEGVRAEVWDRLGQLSGEPDRLVAAPGEEVVRLAEARAAARLREDWAGADAFRQALLDMGWEIRDTLEGFELVPAPQR